MVHQDDKSIEESKENSKQSLMRLSSPFNPVLLQIGLSGVPKHVHFPTKKFTARPKSSKLLALRCERARFGGMDGRRTADRRLSLWVATKGRCLHEDMVITHISTAV